MLTHFMTYFAVEIVYIHMQTYVLSEHCVVRSNPFTYK